MMKLTIVLFAALVALSSAALDIDLFSGGEDGFEIDEVGFMSLVTGSLDDDDTVGGARRLGMNLTEKNSVRAGASIDVTEREAVEVSIGTGAVGEASITWDGGAEELDTMGLGGIDLTLLENDAFEIEIPSWDLTAPLAVKVYDTEGGVSEFSQDVPGGTGDGNDGLNMTYEYANFTGDADFTSVGAIQLIIGPREALDAVVGRISTFAINGEPEPTTEEPTTEEPTTEEPTTEEPTTAEPTCNKDAVYFAKDSLTSEQIMVIMDNSEALMAAGIEVSMAETGEELGEMIAANRELCNDPEVCAEGFEKVCEGATETNMGNGGEATRFSRAFNDNCRLDVIKEDTSSEECAEACDENDECEAYFSGVHEGSGNRRCTLLSCTGRCVPTMTDSISCKRESCPEFRDCNCKPGGIPTYFTDDRGCEQCSCKRAPATRAPATRAPATRAPATRAPATRAPATRAPRTRAPATRAPATRAPATCPPYRECNCPPGGYAVEYYDSNGCKNCSCKRGAPATRRP